MTERGSGEDRSAAARLFASGRVQGVGYRWFVRAGARSLGLDGWVRNLRDGRVEAWAHGGRAAIEALAERMREGPPGSAVRGVDLAWLPDGPPPTPGFEILPTA